MKSTVGLCHGDHRTGDPAPRIEALESRWLLSAPEATAMQGVGTVERQVPRAALSAEPSPSIRTTNPKPDAIGVDPGVDVIAHVNLPNGAGIINDPAILAANVRLSRVGDDTP